MDNKNIIHIYIIHKSVRYIEKNEIKNRLFGILNDMDNLPIQDIVIDDRNNIVNVYLTDDTRFFVHVEKCGIWNICEV